MSNKRVHVMRQSWLNETLGVCNERGRAILTGEMPRRENDAAAKGTAVHAGIELCLDSMINQGEPLGLAAMVDHGMAIFDGISALPNFHWVKVKSRDTIKAHVVKMLTDWYNDVMPQLSPVDTEIKFSDIPLYEDDERIILLEGTRDYEDANGDWDWKTASRQYETWEYERWAIQPTVYSYAKAWERNRLDEPFEFTYCVLFPYEDKSPQIFSVTRGPKEFNWLKDQCLSLAIQIEAELPVWPKNDQTALCSQKWCGLWSSCRGKHV